MVRSCQSVLEVHLCCTQLSNKLSRDEAKTVFPAVSSDRLSTRNTRRLHANADHRDSFDLDRHLSSRHKSHNIRQTCYRSSRDNKAFPRALCIVGLPIAYRNRNMQSASYAKLVPPLPCTRLQELSVFWRREKKKSLLINGI
jgi:hypothetical protein